MKQPKEYFNTGAEDKAGASMYIIFIKALVICFVLAFILIVLYGVMLSITPLSDATMGKIVSAIIIISVAIATIYGGKRVQKKGWLFGLIMGLVFVVLLVPMNLILGQGFSFDSGFIMKLLLGSTVGLIGGVIGVNLK